MVTLNSFTVLSFLFCVWIPFFLLSALLSALRPFCVRFVQRAVSLLSALYIKADKADRADSSSNFNESIHDLNNVLFAERVPQLVKSLARNSLNGT